MCGIVGILGLSPGADPDESSLNAMTDAIVHRGPDDSGTVIRGPLGFGFRRLSIIDLSAAGHQPLQVEDGRYWIVFNGEAYNFLELRTQLEQHGVVFRSRTDTEVVLQAYRVFGVDFVRHVRGMFACAIWDDVDRSLVLVRDRLGKKPLHYIHDGRRFAFASEIKSLLTLPSVSRDLDWDAVEEYFCYGYVCSPRTIYRNIRKVRPGHILRIRNGTSSEEPYWQLTPAADISRMDDHEVKKSLQSILRDAVRMRMISDVPLGAFLSGGVDSSLVVAMMAEQSRSPVRTFSIGFGEPEYDESAFARAVAERLSTDHTEIIVRPNYTDLLVGLLQDFDEPFGDSSALPTYIVAHETRRSVTVALSGDGGDEAFGGYDLYAESLAMGGHPWFRKTFGPLLGSAGEVWPATLRGGRRVREWGFSAPGELFIHRSTIFDRSSRRHLFRPDLLRRCVSGPPELSKRDLLKRASGFPPILQLQYNDLHHYLPDDILVKVDRMSMLTSLEVRSPLLDHTVIEFAFGLPLHLLSAGQERKILLRRLLSDYLPAGLIDRPKRGFAIPKGEWLRKELAPLFRSVVFSDRFGRLGIFDMRYVRHLFETHLEGKRDLSNPLWLLLCFGIWNEGSTGSDGK